MEKSAPEGNDASAEKVIEDLKTAARDAEEFVRSKAEDLSEKTRAGLTEALDSARKACHVLEEKAIEGAKVTDKAIRSHPYESVGLAFGVGLLIGVLVSRK